MKNATYFSVLSILFGLLGCNQDDTTESLSIRLEYEQEPEALFMTSGSTAPLIIDWNGEPGTFEISTDSEILNRNIITFDTNTGVLSWDKRLPLSEFEFMISAQNSRTSTTIKLTLKNTFTSGFFSGGFAVDTSDEPNFSEIPPGNSLTLNEDKTIKMTRVYEPSFSAVGEWAFLGNSTFSIEFISSLSAPDTIYMNGHLSASTGRFAGQYGSSINEDKSIKDQTGIFIFYPD